MAQYADQIGGDVRALTASEETFLDGLLEARPRLAVWRHRDDDGTPWLIVSLDITRDRTILRTLRLDYDGTEIVGGWSPAALNWDSGVRADAAGIDSSSSAGIRERGKPEELAAVAGSWFDRHA